MDRNLGGLILSAVGIGQCRPDFLRIEKDQAPDSDTGQPSGPLLGAKPTQAGPGFRREQIIQEPLGVQEFR